MNLLCAVGACGPAPRGWTATARIGRQAPVAQLDRASVYGTEGQRFESSRARYEEGLEPQGFGPFLVLGRELGARSGNGRGQLSGATATAASRTQCRGSSTAHSAALRPRSVPQPTSPCARQPRPTSGRAIAMSPPYDWSAPPRASGRVGECDHRTDFVRDALVADRRAQLEAGGVGYLPMQCRAMRHRSYLPWFTASSEFSRGSCGPLIPRWVERPDLCLFVPAVS